MFKHPNETNPCHQPIVRNKSTWLFPKEKFWEEKFWEGLPDCARLIRQPFFNYFTVIAADTPENQEVFPQNPSQKEGLGFPIIRGVSLSQTVLDTFLFPSADATHQQA